MSQTTTNEPNANTVEAAVVPTKPEEKGLRLRVPIVLFTVLVFIAFVFCSAAISIGMMDKPDSPACISIWGYKPHCYKTWFRHIYWDAFGPAKVYCKKGDSLMQAAQAFSVMSVICGSFTVIVGLLELFRFAELAVVSCIISMVNTVATMVTWATMLAMYWANLCGQGVFADEYRLGAGLILFITAWCLQMVANIILVVEVYTGGSR